MGRPDGYSLSKYGSVPPAPPLNQRAGGRRRASSLHWRSRARTRREARSPCSSMRKIPTRVGVARPCKLICVVEEARRQIVHAGVPLIDRSRHAAVVGYCVSLLLERAARNSRQRIHTATSQQQPPTINNLNLKSAQPISLTRWGSSHDRQRRGGNQLCYGRQAVFCVPSATPKSPNEGLLHSAMPEARLYELAGQARPAPK